PPPPPHSFPTRRSSDLRCLLDEVEGSAAHLLTNALPPRQLRYLVAKRDRYELGVRSLIASGMRAGEFVSGDAALVARAMLGALRSEEHTSELQSPCNLV